LIVNQAIELERERQEGIRVAYVAATRARDLLVVPAIGDEEYDRWIGALNRAIYPAVADRRTPRRASGCPDFNRDSVLNRPDDEVARATTVCPGLHQLADAAEGSAYEVVWWDPAALRLDADPPFGLRRQELISKDVPPEVVAQGERRFIAWRDARKRAIAAGEAPSISVRTATECASCGIPDSESWRSGPGLTDIEIVTLDAERDRPGGVRYGTLVHATLATVPLDAGRDVIESIARTQGRIVGAVDDEIESAIAVARAAIGHPLLVAAHRARQHGGCFREVPVTVSIDGTLVEGIVDLAFDDGPTMVVVDFKTDRELEGALDAYRRQVQIYAHAIATATGKPARGVLMKI
jgi:hypothetical protein